MEPAADRLVIRDFVPSDREAYLAFCEAFFDSPAVLHKLPRASMERTFDAIRAGSPFLRGLLLELDGAAVGYAQLSFTWSNEVGGPVVWLEEFYLSPVCRGQGAGSAFLTWLLREYADSARRVRLEVTEENESAARLYERFGFGRLSYRQYVLDK